MRVVLLTAALFVLGAAQAPSPSPDNYTWVATPLNSTGTEASQDVSLVSHSAPAQAQQASAPSSLSGSESFSSRPNTNAEFPRGSRFILPEVQPIGLSPPDTSGSAQTETAPVPVAHFVQRSGQNFVVNGSVHFFPGSNDYFLILR